MERSGASTMDSKRTNHPQLVRERAVYNYLESLESGDLDGIIDVLQQAVYDASLDQMVVDTHLAYFQHEQLQKVALADIETHEMPVPELAPQSAYGMRQLHGGRTKRMSRWAQILAAVLILAVLVGSFITLLTLRGVGIGRA